jgi:Resolvase, N terminal domain
VILLSNIYRYNSRKISISHSHNSNQVINQAQEGWHQPFVAEFIMGMRVGYARVSSVGQKLDVQLDKLADCDRIYQEKVSAGSKKLRLELQNIDCTRRIGKRCLKYSV